MPWTGQHRRAKVGNQAAHRGLGRAGQWRVVAAVAAGLVGLSAVVAAQDLGVALAEDEQRIGSPVPPEYVEAITVAALSCPSLTAPRLAGQLMALSGFDPEAVTSNGGVGVAGLTTDMWNRWAPWAGAKRTDPAANIVALARQMCDLVGQLRAAEVNSEPWRSAVAAQRVGLDAVIEAGNVPASAASHVRTVAAYAAWYAHQPPLADPSNASPLSVVDRAAEGSPSARSSTRAVPSRYVAAVNAAGSICSAVTPQRIAAQIIVTSGFDAKLSGPGGRQGIAQFTPELWSQYAGSQAESAWDPQTSIRTLGRAMCDLVTQLSALPGDPYVLALSAFELGVTAVRLAGGVPDSPNLSAFTQRVLSYATAYTSDPHLMAAIPTPTGSSSPTPTVRPTVSPTASPSTVNLALRRPCTNDSHNTTNICKNAVDGDLETFWQSYRTTPPQFLEIDLGASMKVGRVVISLPPTWGQRIQTFFVSGSTDDKSFATLVATASYKFKESTGNSFSIVFPATTVRYIELDFTTPSTTGSAQVAEFGVYAS